MKSMVPAKLRVNARCLAASSSIAVCPSRRQASCGRVPARHAGNYFVARCATHPYRRAVRLRGRSAAIFEGADHTRAGDAALNGYPEGLQEWCDQLRRLVWVEPCRSISVLRMAAYGASFSL